MSEYIVNGNICNFSTPCGGWEEKIKMHEYGNDFKSAH